MANDSNVFDSDSLIEEIKVNGQILKLRPLKIKEFRRFIFIVEKALESFSQMNSKTSIKTLVDTLLEKHTEVMQVFFPTTMYSFMTNDFLEDNFDIPLSRHVLERMVKINKLEDLFPALKKLELSGEQESKTNSLVT